MKHPNQKCQAWPSRGLNRIPSALAAIVASTLFACSSSTSAPALPVFSPTNFSNGSSVDHPLFQLIPGSIVTHLESSTEGDEVIVIEVLDATRTVLGVPCRVVRDRVFEEGMLVEDTHDWFAQDNAGNVWYMGEDVVNYEYDADDNLLGTDSDGSWEAGLDVNGLGHVAQPGYQMPASPRVGQSFAQEHYATEAEDKARVESLSVSITLDSGESFDCVQFREWTPLEPGNVEYKYYAPGEGLVKTEKVGSTDAGERVGSMHMGASSLPDFASATFTNPTVVDNPLLPFAQGDTHLQFARTEDEAETIVLEVLPGTRTVFGVQCIRVRDRVFVEDLLIEDTEDWYAQDDAGNVWYMGEEVVNYEYDEDGSLLGTDTDGSWEAGVDILGAGSIALPGWSMPATLEVGRSIHQEFYEGEATDIFQVLATGLTLTLDGGATFANVVQTLDINPLDPGEPELKYYAPGIGFIREEKIGGEEVLENLGTLHLTPDSLPTFAVADFSTPTIIDNSFLPLPFGITTNFVADTEDGEETIVIDVTGTTRMVNGIVCSVVRDRVYLEGILQEDTLDFFAQDDMGNVWYLGEEVDNYNYDENGNLDSIDNDGSWEAGLDVAGVGSIAQPGWVMRNNPVAGSTYRQELYVDEAEDMAIVVATGVTVELSDGSTYSNCVQTLDWNPLEPAALEYKFYAPGIGVVVEHALVENEFVEITP